MTKILMLVGCIMMISSCGPILKLTLGIEAPKYKTDGEVREYADKKIKTDLTILRISDYDGDTIIPLNVTRMPSLKFIVDDEIKDLGETCIADYTFLIKSPLDSLRSLSTSYTIQEGEFENHFYNINDGGFNFSIDEPIFYVFYANYGGFLNKKKLVPWIEELEKRTDVNYVLVNCDISKNNNNKKSERGKIKFEF